MWRRQRCVLAPVERQVAAAQWGATVLAVGDLRACVQAIAVRIGAGIIPAAGVEYQVLFGRRVSDCVRTNRGDRRDWPLPGPVAASLV